MQKEFSEHLAYVFNQVVQIVRKQGYTKESMQECGKLLWRLYRVYMAYRTKSKELTQKEWLNALMELGKQFSATVTG